MDGDTQPGLYDAPGRERLRAREAPPVAGHASLRSHVRPGSAIRGSGVRCRPDVLVGRIGRRIHGTGDCPSAPRLSALPGHAHPRLARPLRPPESGRPRRAHSPGVSWRTPKAVSANICPEGQGLDGAGWATQPGADLVAVSRKGRPQQASVAQDAPMVGARVCDDDPCTHGRWPPTVVGCDPYPKSNPSVHHGHQLLWVDDARLELDDEQAACRGMPGQDVDDTPLAVDGEGHLRQPGPSGRTSKLPSKRLMQRGVSGIHDPVEVATRPAEPDVDADAQRGCHATERLQWQSIGPASLEPPDDLPPDAGAFGDIDLPLALPGADRAQRLSHPDVVHDRTVTSVPSRRLRRDFACASRSATGGPPGSGGATGGAIGARGRDRWRFWRTRTRPGVRLPIPGAVPERGGGGRYHG